MRVLIAEDDSDFRSMLSAVIETDPTLTLAGAAADAEEAIQLAWKLQPDVALLDVGMPKGGGVHAAGKIREVSPATQVLALSGSDEREAVIRMLRAGANSYLVKGATPDEILSAIRRAASGETILAPRAAQEIVQALRGRLTRENLRDQECADDRERIERFVQGEGLQTVVQPIVYLRSDAVVGYEALTRFNGEPRLRPDEWLVRAERVGLRAELELAIFRRAVDLISEIPAGTFLSVNLSPDVLSSSKEGDIPVSPSIGHRLVIELTEHARVDDYASLIKRLTQLRGTGVRFAVDDAGAGFASLQHILQLAPEFIKLDITLTRHIDDDSPRRALAASLINFTKQINATLIAEGIETKRELLVLRRLGVMHGQGFYLARPAPVDGWTIPGIPTSRMMQLLQASTAGVRRVQTVKAALTALGRVISSEFSLDRVSLGMLVPRDQLRLVGVWSRVTSSLATGSLISAVATSFPEALRRDGPICSSDVSAYPSFAERLVRDEGIQSWISLPIHRMDGAVSGLLSFSSKEPETFGEATLGLFAQLGHAVEAPLVALAMNEGYEPLSGH
jgi:EAL domain-containing protein (putative c-di-GMP-specific phosphodiesterase class I)/CheY-like chemotaxis protein